MKYSTFFMIDQVRQYDYLLEDDQEDFGNIVTFTDSNETESFQVVCAAICEDLVILPDYAKNARAVIIHYLATHPT